MTNISTKKSKRKKRRKSKGTDKQLISNRFNTDTPNNGPYCLVTCQHDGLDQAESMVRCCIWMKWVHPISCCNDLEQDADHAGVYTCSSCRTISEHLLNLEKTVDTLHTMNKDLIRLLEPKEQECADLRKLLSSDSTTSTIDLDVPATANSNIPDPITRQSKPIPKPRTSTQKYKFKPKVNLLGDSMVRNSGEHLAKSLPNTNTCVYSKSGLSIETATKIASQIFYDHKEKDIAILHMGTNNLNEHKPDVLCSKYDKLIHKVKNTVTKSRIIVTGIADRITPGSPPIYQNNHLCSRCSSDKSLAFIDPNPELIQRNYRHDGIHFNYNGIYSFRNLLAVISQLQFSVSEELPSSLANKSDKPTNPCHFKHLFAKVSLKNVHSIPGKNGKTVLYF